MGMGGVHGYGAWGMGTCDGYGDVWDMGMDMEGGGGRTHELLCSFVRPGEGLAGALSGGMASMLWSRRASLDSTCRFVLICTQFCGAAPMQSLSYGFLQ